MADYQEKNGTFTVSELIAALQKMPPELLVYTEGCCSIGCATAVSLKPNAQPPEVLIERWG